MVDLVGSARGQQARRSDVSSGFTSQTAPSRLQAARLIMPLLIEFGSLHYMLANVLTVGVCSVANFVAADRVVFRDRFPFAEQSRQSPSANATSALC